MIMRAKLSLGSAVMATIVLAIVASIHAQQAAPTRTQAGTPLTAQDFLDIQQLVARYAYAMDSGADNGFAYADLFTLDGEFVSPTGTIKGREALAAAGRSGFVNGHKPANGVSHFIVNNVVTPSAEGATGKQYVVLVNIGEDDKPGGSFSDVGGHYEDVYVKTSQGWKFKRREFVSMKFERRPPAGNAAR
jgi:SnoaL-like domain